VGKIRHIAISVQDLEKTTAFYKEAFNLIEEPDSDQVGQSAQSPLDFSAIETELKGADVSIVGIAEGSTEDDDSEENAESDDTEYV